MKRCIFCKGENITGFEWCSFECYTKDMIDANRVYLELDGK